LNTNYVLGFVFNKSRTKVALIKKNRPEWQAGKLNGIGGKIEENEACVDAMSREFLEETGYFIERNEWRHVLTMEREDPMFTCYVFRYFSEVENLEDILKTTTDEEIIIVPIDSIIKCFVSPMLDHIHWLLGILLDTNHKVPYHISAWIGE
jgi:8-oxo-dGTP diphosphatase